MLLKYIVYVMAVSSLISLGSCEKSVEERYKEYEKNEVLKGERHDSLFYGIYLNMSKKDFRTYCYDMNLKGKFKQGGLKNSNWVEAKVSEMQYPAAINFYPEFKNDTITEMNASIYYDNATFKDKVFEPDSLMLDVLNLMDSWYGGNTFKIKSPFFYEDDIYVKVKGNRRITIYPEPGGNLINIWFVDINSVSVKKDAHDF